MKEELKEYWKQNRVGLILWMLLLLLIGCLAIPYYLETKDPSSLGFFRLFLIVSLLSIVPQFVEDVFLKVYPRFITLYRIVYSLVVIILFIYLFYFVPSKHSDYDIPFGAAFLVLMLVIIWLKKIPRQPVNVPDWLKNTVYFVAIAACILLIGFLIWRVVFE